jgi:hypothetical protein
MIMFRTETLILILILETQSKFLPLFLLFTDGQRTFTFAYPRFPGKRHSSMNGTSSPSSIYRSSLFRPPYSRRGRNA